MIGNIENKVVAIHGRDISRRRGYELWMELKPLSIRKRLLFFLNIMLLVVIKFLLPLRSNLLPTSDYFAYPQLDQIPKRTS